MGNNEEQLDNSSLTKLIRNFLKNYGLQEHQLAKNLDYTNCDCGYCYECAKTSRIMEKY